MQINQNYKNIIFCLKKSFIVFNILFNMLNNKLKITTKKHRYEFYTFYRKKLRRKNYLFDFWSDPESDADP